MQTNSDLSLDEQQVGQLSDALFNKVRAAVRERMGISIPTEKRINVVARLRRLVVRGGHGTIEKYCSKLLHGRLNAAELDAFLSQFSTNHTFFYRESKHFDHFKQNALPYSIAYQKARDRDLRIWCAASSTGEEPYTLAFLTRQAMTAVSGVMDWGVLATDISPRVIEVGTKGIYVKDKVDRLPLDMRKRYFKSVPGQADSVVVRPDIRKKVAFRTFNLLTPKYPFPRAFDSIFCRNVMIYFDRDTVRLLAKKLHDVLVPGGYLYIGHSERFENDSPFTRVAPSVYRRSLV